MSDTPETDAISYTFKDPEKRASDLDKLARSLERRLREAEKNWYASNRDIARLEKELAAERGAHERTKSFNAYHLGRLVIANQRIADLERKLKNSEDEQGRLMLRVKSYLEELTENYKLIAYMKRQLDLREQAMSNEPVPPSEQHPKKRKQQST